MKLLIVRHAIAEDRLEFAKREVDDGERPLTAKGIERMRAGTRGLKRVIERVDVLATSPLMRARQTADVLQEGLGAPKPMVVEQLTPGRDPEELADWLGLLPAEATVAAVGHEPDLSELVGWLTTGEAHSLVELKKGGACLLAIPGSPCAGGATLEWLLPPRLMRLLGGS
jgi:phosphohistidine phosphatase